MPKNNMSIWDGLCETDPKYVKDFDTGRFQGSSINPQYKWKRLTEMFGPAGEGWGIDQHSADIVPVGEEKLVCISVTGFYMKDGVRYLTPPGFGQNYIVKRNKYGDVAVDEDAYKKAFTDALGNAFKYIGLSADVYLRSFEDDKYVESLKEKYSKAEDHIDPAPVALPPVPEQYVDFLKVEGDVITALPQETDDAKTDLANVVAWYLTQCSELSMMINCCKQFHKAVDGLRTSNNVNPIEEGTCDWTVDKLRNVKTRRGLDGSWKKIGAEVNALKDEVNAAFTGITKAFRDAKEDIDNGKRS